MTVIVYFWFLEYSWFGMVYSWFLSLWNHWQHQFKQSEVLLSPLTSIDLGGCTSVEDCRKRLMRIILLERSMLSTTLLKIAATTTITLPDSCSPDKNILHKSHHSDECSCRAKFCSSTHHYWFCFLCFVVKLQLTYDDTVGSNISLARLLTGLQAIGMYENLRHFPFYGVP